MVRPPAIPEHLDQIGREVVDSAFRVHTELGPGLLESVDESCLEHELEKKERFVARQVSVPIQYDGVDLDAGLRLDLVVDESVIVEVNAVERMLPVFEAQLLTSLKLSNKRLGYLIDFNVPLIRDGIRRMVL